MRLAQLYGLSCARLEAQYTMRSSSPDIFNPKGTLFSSAFGSGLRPRFLETGFLDIWIDATIRITARRERPKKSVRRYIVAC